MWFARLSIEKMLIFILDNKKRGPDLFWNERKDKTVSKRPNLCKASRERKKKKRIYLKKVKIDSERRVIERLLARSSVRSDLKKHSIQSYLQ